MAKLAIRLGGRGLPLPCAMVCWLRRQGHSLFHLPDICLSLSSIIVSLGSASERAKGWGAGWAKSGHFNPALLPHVIGQVRHGRGRKGKYKCWKQSLGLLLFLLNFLLFCCRATICKSNIRARTNISYTLGSFLIRRQRGGVLPLGVSNLANH